MNTSFLAQCAAHVYAQHHARFPQTTVVFPNKRAIIFFKQHLGEHISKPVFTPNCTTIQDLFVAQSAAFVPDTIVLIHLLYTVYVKHTKSTESFDMFFSWGEMLLHDFHDIDMYRVNVDLLFENISLIKDYEQTFHFLSQEQIAHISRFWNVISVESESESKKKFIEIWNVLGAIYKEYTHVLRQHNYAYHGMAARDCIEKCEKNKAFGDPDMHYCFVGFNALTKCEQDLFTFLKSQTRATFYWDYDVMYTNCSYEHEAGYFLKKYLKKFGNALEEDFFTSFSKEKKISIVSVPQSVTQAKLSADWISQRDFTEQSGTNAAIILADESIITPMLTSIPEHVQYNVSLGYPITATHAYALCIALLQMQSNAKGKAVYYKDMFRVFENPLIPYEKSQAYASFRFNIATKNYLYISSTQWEGRAEFLPYFELVSTPEECIAYMERCILHTVEYAAVSEIEKSVLYLIHKELKQLSFLLQTHEIRIDSLSFLVSLITKAVFSKTIAIQGEPLHDLQIMGILETRTLDFSHILLLSVNEGVFPKTSVGSSFIPYSLRIGFGMPTIKEQTAIYSYYFYRLLQRAQDVTLVYSTNVTSDGKGEMSRYIMQLLYEQSNPLHTIKKTDVSFPLLEQQTKTIEVEQRQETIDFFNKYSDGNHALSPSAITCYLTCSLQFYFKYIQKLELQQKQQDLPNEADYGNFFHTAMETLYAPFVEKSVEKSDIQSLLDDKAKLKKCVEQAVLTVLYGEKHNTIVGGVESLAIHTTLTYVENTLRYDLQRTPFFLCGIEMRKTHNIKLSHGNFYIGGIIDRYEIYKEVHTIIDYKTGESNYSVSSLFDLFDRTKAERNKAALQSLIYAYVVSESESVRATILLYFIRAIHTNTDSRIIINKNPLLLFEEVREEFVDLLTELLEEMISAPFIQTAHQAACAYCDFKRICGRL
ncbi:MAG: PD-(D/E)XK nuclease family protein [Bacteroidales bacterium]|nr:PD-(D/E)XK nuclease family protein [Bacteroidales bacterium]